MDDLNASSRREIFGHDGMLRANADCAAVGELYRIANCDRDVGNDAPLAGWSGAPREPFSRAVRRAYLGESELALIAAIHYASEATRTIRECIGGEFIVASARVFATQPHGQGDPGLGPLFDTAPPGVVRTITFLHDLDQTSSPFELRAHAEVLVPSTPRGTMVVFDAHRVHWRERPPLRGTRVILDAVCIRSDRAPQVGAVGMNYWPRSGAADGEWPVFLFG